MLSVVWVGLLGSKRGGDEVCVILVSDNDGMRVSGPCVGEEDVVGVVCGEGV